MELTELESTVIEALMRGDPEERILRLQLDTATVARRDYSGVGLFTNIEVSQDCQRLSKTATYIEETPKTHLEHPHLEAGAGAILWLENGKMATLECFTYGGAWPQDESLFTIST